MAELTERLLLEVSKSDNISSIDLAKTLATDHQVRVESSDVGISVTSLENSRGHQEPGESGRCDPNEDGDRQEMESYQRRGDGG